MIAQWPSAYQFSSCKESHLGGVGVQTDLVFSWSVGGEGEPAVWPILTRKDNLAKNKDGILEI